MVLAGLFLANALEWFDLVIFGYLAAVLGRLFFPAQSEFAAISFAFATFGVTLLARPLGAVVLGAYGDRYGRKTALILSASLMTVGTATMAVLPTYASVGAVSTILLVIARTMQGFSAGGEFGNATTYLAEYDQSRRGFYASLQFSSQGFTAFLATSFGALLTSSISPADLESWGWRLPFVFGALLGPVVYVLRRHASESLEFDPSNAPLRELSISGKGSTLISAALVTLGTAVTYTIIFLPTYAHAYLGFSPYSSFLGGLTTATVLMCFTPLAGAASDHLGRFPVIVLPTLALLITSYPGFAWLSAAPSTERLLSLHIYMGLLAACYLGVLPSLMAELFPARFRSTGLSVSYAIGVTSFGAFAPLMMTWLIQISGNKAAPSFYLIFAALISLIGLGLAWRNRLRTGTDWARIERGS
jgi:MHS family proline/betaine transporter-like MFS transporter